MRDDPAVDRFQLVFLSVTIVVLFLCLTWSTAYGYSFSRIDNIASQTNAPQGSEGNSSALKSSMTSYSSYSDRFSWNDDESFARDTDDGVPASCPPPTPEPATLVLIGMGLAGAAVYTRLRR